MVQAKMLIDTVFIRVGNRNYEIFCLYGFIIKAFKF